ncbi:FGGY-family carbohydrate kinase [Hoeflea sp. WL0058]|uniref:FGGY-family carbohydrate kinase n=1 Tax=Flavimaribacter sediminis TaxID=2865987 RepID=A0AAE2ZP29_9HYPH|nr:FGGY-family carbohydrate kinase [Flavimaribacter sediminis]MBW8637843.1 FGGY-family carbohydrate kinase [Flavimaribacter sediminis]
MSDPVFIGVDVGTGSARAGMFDADGVLLASHKHDIRIWRETGDIAEQSSDDIWSAVCVSVRAVLEEADIAPDRVAGIGFDAACSLVVLDADMKPLSVSRSGDDARNVIVWMDHRAVEQADRINVLGHRVLDYVGGRISPEMQTPKLLWLKENMPETYHRAGQFFDLPDFLTWAATGSLARSACTVTCKWTYLAHEGAWDSSYFREIGLGELPAENYARIGRAILSPGAPLGNGLAQEAADALGLLAGTAVGAGLIDAHAGGVGTVGADHAAGPERTMAYVFGTSACTMSSSSEAHFVPGVWGPYFSAMVPGLWLSEGGQSAAGEAIAHLIATHPARAEAEALAEAAGETVQGYLLAEVERRHPEASGAVTLAGSRIVVPDFLGNRAPYADPHATAVISGLTLENGLDDLIASYVAAVLGVGYGLRKILDTQSAHGVTPGAVVLSGGAAESDTVKQLLADACGRPVLSTTSPAPVLLGAAMLGAIASGHQPTLQDCMRTMSHVGARFEPADGRIAAIHAERLKAYDAFQDAERALRAGLSSI